MDKTELIVFLETIIKEAYFKFIENKREEITISDKGNSDIVTTHDLLIEQFIIEKLKEKFPNDAVIAEESHQNVLSRQRTWIIDPIDGTVNYALNHPFYGIQIGLIENNEGLVSCVYLPALNEFYYAVKDNGAYLNHQPLSVNHSVPLNRTIITFGDFSSSNLSTRPIQLSVMKEVMDKIMKIRIQGASSIDFSFVASGKTHAHIIFSKRIWEIQPGLLLAKEAGAIVHALDYHQTNQQLKGAIVASNQQLLDLILTTIETCLKH